MLNIIAADGVERARFREFARAAILKEKGQTDFLLQGILEIDPNEHMIAYHFRVRRDFTFVAGQTTDMTAGTVTLLPKHKTPPQMPVVLKKWQIIIDEQIRPRLPAGPRITI